MKMSFIDGKKVEKKKFWIKEVEWKISPSPPLKKIWKKKEFPFFWIVVKFFLNKNTGDK